MWWTDVFSTYFYGLKIIALVVAVLILLSGIDDLFIDVVYWWRRLWRALTIYRRHERLGYQALYQPEEKPLAIMVPAWQETGVIGKMAELAATTLDYENYHIFVGTYPNDPDTQRDVDAVCVRFPNVHKVVCARPGPTSKADCLNNVLDAIFQFEKSINFTFAGFILHDAEDVVSSMELRLFNLLVDRKDLIQLPVYPFERKWTHFTSLHYLDEFAENHGKDILVREALAGQVPSAGVGTCFSRRAVLALLADGDDIAFDVQSLTEDYDIGFRLKQKGMSEIFVRFPVVRDDAPESSHPLAFGSSLQESSVICVREYFPDTLQAAVRQKSRWIIGIIFQGFKSHKWTSNWTINYFLWRDRKGALSNFVSFGAMLILLQLVLLWLYQQFWPNAYHFLSIFDGDALLVTLLFLNFWPAGSVPPPGAPSCPAPDRCGWRRERCVCRRRWSARQRPCSAPRWQSCGQRRAAPPAPPGRAAPGRRCCSTRIRQVLMMFCALLLKRPMRRTCAVTPSTPRAMRAINANCATIRIARCASASPLCLMTQTFCR